MLAYVFWHRPAPGADVAGYERALLAFHAALAADPPPGFHGSAAFDRLALPWFDGYEDWYLVDDWAALGALNAAAVDAAHRLVHDDVASRAGAGTAQILALHAGAPTLDVTAVRWADAEPRGDAVWRRQMTLGPAPEWCALQAAAGAGTWPRRRL